MRNKHKYKVRFHLGKPKGFWQITNVEDNTVKYINPSKYNLILNGCFLRNQKGTAEKVFKTGQKTVCAWIECQEIFATFEELPQDTQVFYNPHINPHWIIDSEEVDYQSFDCIVTNGKKLFLKKDSK